MCVPFVLILFEQQNIGSVAWQHRVCVVLIITRAKREKVAVDAERATKNILEARCSVEGVRRRGAPTDCCQEEESEKRRQRW